MNSLIRCVICGGYSGNGIGILNRYICEECEKTLVNIDINDIRYDEYKNMIKEKIYSELALKEKLK